MASQALAPPAQHNGDRHIKGDSGIIPGNLMARGRRC